MSDTPETNSIIRNAQAADHPPTRLAATLTVKCEKLERERDEAREALEFRRELYKVQEKCLEDARRERDEAFQLLASEKTTRNHIIKRSVEVEQERDEAREKVEQQRKEIVRLNGATNHAGGTPLKIALRERDEALFLLKAAQSALDAIHLEVGGWIKIMKENTD